MICPPAQSCHSAIHALCVRTPSLSAFANLTSGLNHNVPKKRFEFELSTDSNVEISMEVGFRLPSTPPMPLLRSYFSALNILSRTIGLEEVDEKAVGFLTS